MTVQTLVRLAGFILILTLAGAPAQAGWNQAKSRHFIVYSDGPAKELQSFTEKFEKFDFLLRKVTGTPDNETGAPVLVYTVPSADAVAKLAGRPHIAGFYNTSRRNGYAVVGRERKDNEFDMGAEDILFHEYAHHFMLHYFPAAYPPWYIEGFAEFYSIVKFTKAQTIMFGYPPLSRAYGLVVERPLPLRQLFSGDTGKMNQTDMDRYYGTAWLLTHFFRYTPARGDEFQKYMSDTVSGTAKDADSYFAGGLETLDRELRVYLRHKLSASELTPGEMPKITVTLSPLEPGQAALTISEVRRLAVGMDKETLAAFTQEVRGIAARFPQSSFAQALLADVERDADAPDAALAAAERAIALDPRNARALGTKADILLDRARGKDDPAIRKAALSAIVQANRADTEDAVPLFQFYQYHQMHGGTMPQIAYDGLNKAFALVPQNDEYRMTLAMSLADRKDYGSAARLLDPIAFSPHPSSGRDQAAQMRAALLKAEASGEPPDYTTAEVSAALQP